MESQIEVSFEVKKIRHRTPETGYTIAEVVFQKYNSTFIPTSEKVVIGNFVSILEGDEFEGVGTWVNDYIYGYGFNLKESKLVLPKSEKGMMDFLQRNIKGLGKKTAENIVNTFGLQTISKAQEDWRHLLKIKGLGQKRAIVIHETLKQHKKMEEIALYIMNHGGTYDTAFKVYEYFGDESVSTIQRDPYQLCRISKVQFLDVDKIAKAENISFNNIERTKAGIEFFLANEASVKGNLYVTYNVIENEINEFLLRFGAYKTLQEGISIKQVKEAVDVLKKQEKIATEYNDAGELLVYKKGNFVIEERIISALQERILDDDNAFASTSVINDFLMNYEESRAVRLARKQQESVHMTMSSGLSVLTGGPGTGKTQTINTILECIFAHKKDAIVHLCAPTGIASKRMTQMTGREAQTIHRKIGLNGFDVESSIDKLEGDFLIVDESSMIDAYIFYKLLMSAPPEMRIVFVGDYQQLPSVGPGLILRDLIESHRVPVTILTEIFRQAQESQIVMNSHKLIAGKKTTDIEGIKFDKTKNDFYFIQKSNVLDAQQALLASVERMIKNVGYKLEDIQILAPMRKGDLGVDELNRLMQQRFNPPTATKREVKKGNTSLLRTGDRVIQTVNNYELEVFNGEVGYISYIGMNINGDDVVEVKYGEKVVNYNMMAVNEVDLAYVITIHKSQGSEFPVVIIPIHSSHERMLTRNLIYTAWTRAKKVVVNIGMKSALDKAIDEKDSTIRNSQIREKLLHINLDKSA